MKKRFLIAIVIILAAIVISGMRRPEYADFYQEYYVSEGETLWSISDEITPNNRDIRYTIDEIKEINNIEKGTIYEGDIILIPIYE